MKLLSGDWTCCSIWFNVGAMFLLSSLMHRMVGPIWTLRLLKEKAARLEAEEALRAISMVKYARETANVSKEAYSFIMEVGGMIANM